jgi:hypothetical protein
MMPPSPVAHLMHVDVAEVHIVDDLKESLEQSMEVGEAKDPDEALGEADPPAEALDEAAQGRGVTSDEASKGTGEIDAMGSAAGLVVRDDKPFRGIDEVERRDDHRWELDPASAEDDPARP